MNEFVYLYRRPLNPPGSPQQMQNMMERWRAWFADVEKKGRLASAGQPLDSKGGGVVNAKERLSDGPYAETKDVVMGYTVIRASDLQDAIDLAKGHPIFDLGGAIEVRPVMKFGG